MHEDDLSDLAQVWAEYAMIHQLIAPYKLSAFDNLRERVCSKAYDFVADAARYRSLQIGLAELEETFLASLREHTDLFTLLAGTPTSISFLTDADVDAVADRVQLLRDDINGRIARVFGLNKE